MHSVGPGRLARSLLKGLAVLAVLAALLPARGASAAGTTGVEPDVLRWTTAALPVPAGAERTIAASVDCPSAGRCVAVGSWSGSDYRDHPYSWLYDGAAWTGQEVALPPDGSYAALRSVSCPSATVCYAVGDGQVFEELGRPGIVATLTGGTWSSRLLPRAPGDRYVTYHGIDCAAVGACTAVATVYYGYGSSGDDDGVVAATLSGTSWTAATLPDPEHVTGVYYQQGPQAVSCATATSCTAVGDNAALTLADGTWTGAALPRQGADDRGHGWAQYLLGVACSAPRACLAVGGINQSIVQTQGPDGWAARTLWDPNDSNSSQSLNAISCASAGACTAVGRYYDSHSLGLAQTLVDGVWLPSAIAPLASEEELELFGVSCVSPTTCAAVGTASDHTSNRSRPVVATSAATTRPAPSGSSVAPGVAAGTVTWTAPPVTGVTGYDVRVDADYLEYGVSPFRRRLRVDASSTRATLPGLQAGAEHRVKVRARFGLDAGSWTPVTSFTPTGCPGTAFADVAAGGFCPDIAWMVSREITFGTRQADGSLLYKPGAAVARQAMASFLYRSAGFPPFQEPAEATFADVAVGNQFFRDVEWLAASGISTGFANPAGGKRLFKPTEAVTRQAMAPLLYRAAGSPSFTPPVAASFADVATTHPFYREIEWMRAAGITNGTPQSSGKPLYKPSDVVSRQAMAAFLHRAHGS